MLQRVPVTSKLLAFHADVHAALAGQPVDHWPHYLPGNGVPIARWQKDWAKPRHLRRSGLCTDTSRSRLPSRRPGSGTQRQVRSLCWRPEVIHAAHGLTGYGVPPGVRRGPAYVLANPVRDLALERQAAGRAICSSSDLEASG